MVSQYGSNVINKHFAPSQSEKNANVSQSATKFEADKGRRGVWPEHRHLRNEHHVEEHMVNSMTSWICAPPHSEVSESPSLRVSESPYRQSCFSVSSDELMTRFSLTPAFWKKERYSGLGSTAQGMMMDWL